MATLTFDVSGHGPRTVNVTNVLNAGFAGADQESVLAHIEELAELGVPRPGSVPTLYNLTPTVASQEQQVWVHGDRTSGEAEWALVVDDSGEVLLTVASDHTDRQLEVHRIDWGKQIAPDVLSQSAWLLSEVDTSDGNVELKSWGTTPDGIETLLQSGTVDQLLTPAYWLETLTKAGLLKPGTVLLGGTLPMLDPDAQYADRWTVELTDKRRARSLRVSYVVTRLPSLEPAQLRTA
ncbi:DUF2848 family protein [Rhodococcus sp. B10]|uniref:DUF2848 family protein n=1 Tax=Rhodococcus sp. B10 TaxID=2695876 RepID=UPI00142FC5DF|nr:DUF2848 family protein [Rhodococcus sp. B10]NIL77345.1 hypothetical protein [Rhodococcus sp. B10]